MAPKVDDMTFSRLNAEQTRKHLENISQIWSAPLNQRDYVHTECQLASVEANNNSSWWGLHRPGKPLDLVSSCVVYVRDVIIGSKKKVRPAKAAIIAQVFTLPEHRIQGWGKKLLGKVQKQLDGGTMGEIAFSVVYSGVHTNFYEQLGWVPLPASHLRITLGNTDMVSPDKVEGIHAFGYGGLELVAGIDVDICKLRMAGMPDGKTYVQFLAQHKLAKMHIVRSKLLGQVLYRGPADMAHTLYGALYTIQGGTAMAAAWWTHDFRNKRLFIGRIMLARHSGMEYALSRILECACSDAKSWGLRDVLIWDPDEQVKRAVSLLMERLEPGAIKTCLDNRWDAIPCLRWTGEPPTDEVEWLTREHYGLP